MSEKKVIRVYIVFTTGNNYSPPPKKKKNNTQIFGVQF